MKTHTLNKPRLKLDCSGRIHVLSSPAKRLERHQTKLAMPAADIKAALEKSGYTQTDIARMLKDADGSSLRLSTVWLVIKGKGTSRRVAKKVSEIIGIPVSQIWPGKYPELELAESLNTKQIRKPQAKTLDRLLVAYSVFDLAQLAQKIGVPLNTVKSWSRRDSVPLNYMIDAARDTGASLDYLILGICPQGASI